MADNTVLNAGAGGDTIATDDVGGVKYQIVKLADGTDQGTGLIAGDATNGLDVDVTRLPALVAGTANIGDVDVLSIAAGDNNIGNVDVVTLPALVAGTANIGDVDVLTVPAPLSTTGAGTEAAALRVTLASDSTGLVSVDDNGGNLSVDWAGTVPPIGAGTEAAALRVTLATDSTGLVSVDDNAGSLTVDNAQLSVVGTGTEAAALRVTIASDSTGLLSVDDNAGSLTVDVGTALPTGDNNIGNVDVVTLPNVTLAAGTNTNEVVGDVAHDAGVAGNPLLVCGVAQDMDDTAPPNQVSAEADATRIATDRDGAVFVRPFGPRIWSYHENSSNALTDASVHALPGAGLSLYVTDIVCSTGAATAMNIFFEEGASTVLGPYYLEAIAGRGIALHFQTPKKITANTALTVTTSAAIAHSVDVTGFTSQG